MTTTAAVERTIDLNADMGEGFGAWRMGDDDALLDVVTSANVACGFHAGDPTTMAHVCQAAAERGVAVGAHVSYRDLAGFGRRPMDVAPDELTGDVLYQLGALAAFARAAGTEVGYVKPHGALYNRMAVDAVPARAVLEAVRRFDPSLPVMTLADSVVHDLGRRLGVPTVSECFADRAYQSDGTLVSRRQPGAVIDDPEEVAARAVRMATEHLVTAVDGRDTSVAAASVCVHGDTPGAVAVARAVRAALVDAGVTPRPFV